MILAVPRFYATSTTHHLHYPAPVSSMASPSASALADSVSFLKGSILPALNLAKAGVTGIGVPGVEGAVNVIYELATMISTMQANKKDLAELEKSLTLMAAIDVSGATGDLKKPDPGAPRKFMAKATECRSLREKSAMRRLVMGNDYKGKISDIRNRITADIREFTFHGNISIEKLVTDMGSKVMVVDEKVTHAFMNDMLAKLTCSAARYNAENTPEKCMDGTRVDIINEIFRWLTAPPDPSQRVVILSGSAGSGKSTLAKTIASCLAEDNHILAASFFFSRDFADRSDLKLVPATLARQLADYDLGFRQLLVKFIDEDRDGILSADPRVQFKKLVVDLLAQMPPLQTPWIICLDALDECGPDRGERYIQLLLDGIAQIPIHVRFFLTGRPNVPHYLKFDRLLPLTHGIVLDDLDASQVERDIHLYVKQSLDGSTWIPQDSWKALASDVDEITKRAAGLFIFAATAVRYVVSASQRVPPKEAIGYLLGDALLIDLHHLYYHIVGEVIALPPLRDNLARDYRDRAVRILGTIIQLVEPLSPQSLAALLGMNVETLMKTLLPLSAVIRVPGKPDGGPIQIIHLSFQEFITDSIQDLRPDLLCGTDLQKHEIISNILRVLQSELKFNICDLLTSYLRNVNIPDIKWRIQTYISGQLQYACRFWADHLAAISYDSNRAQAAGTFLLNQFLFWLEIMSLLGTVGHAQNALSKFILWAKEESPTVQFARDAKRFVAFFADAINQSAPHIYLSALPLAPTESEIAKRFRPQFAFLISMGRRQLIRWPALVGVLDHPSGVSSVAFSPDGNQIVSGSNDKTLHLWDAETGQALSDPFQGHTDSIRCVTFSPDGKQVVSSSDDKTMRLWDAETGQGLGDPFECHTEWVNSVAFSPDGKWVVSGSNDKTVRLWDAKTRKAVGNPFEGHIDRVRSVAFSPDGKQIASGSSDKTVRLWDIETGQALQHPFEGHSDCVTSVAFSPDGKFIVSGSEDKTVRLWDAETGQAVGDPFKGHTGWVISVAYSPDGKRIVSGSEDTTVCLWDAETGKALCDPFKGHTNRVRSVAFSPDGKQIVSSSYDTTVRLWDAETVEALQHPFEGHTNRVRSVAFSPDGKQIVSGSYDKTVCLWDTETGQALRRPFEGHINGIRSVAFSPNGKQIVSGSEDTTVCLWDAESGEALGDPFKGHTKWVNSVAFSPNGKQIVSGSHDKTLCLWDAKTGKALGVPFKGHTDRVCSVVFSPDGKQIVSGSNDKTLRLWDAETGLALGSPFKGHTDWVNSAAFSPDGKWVVSGSNDKTVRLWDAKTREAVGNPFEGHIDGVRQGRQLASPLKATQTGSGSDDTTVRLWDVETRDALGDPLEGYINILPSGGAFSLDDTHSISSFKPHNDFSLANSLPSVPTNWHLDQGWVPTQPQLQGSQSQ
ncbi:WD40-repeat-containing domain protein [Mycena maculata]|uniref:WD40-repeat-containing domain protein n=1 Tax=Mycena maculata TaxID=230809 RepID=A0AAD7MPX0_9AGAR|nr:WD40-repeat-containing domain protein [Mycena maculata]